MREAGIEAIHWSKVGNPCAPDEEIMSWASQNGYVVFTHDLDFGTILALTRAGGPSVIQVRAQDVMPGALKKIVVKVLMDQQSAISAGALIVIDKAKARIRLFPLK